MAKTPALDIPKDVKKLLKKLGFNTNKKTLMVYEVTITPDETVVLEYNTNEEGRLYCWGFPDDPEEDQWSAYDPHVGQVAFTRHVFPHRHILEQRNARNGD